MLRLIIGLDVLKVVSEKDTSKALSELVFNFAVGTMGACVSCLESWTGLIQFWQSHCS